MESAFTPGVSYQTNSNVRNYITASNCSGSARLANTHDLNNASGNQNVNDQNLELSNSVNYMIMPNQTSGSVKISLHNAVEYPKQIVVMDLLGNVLLEKNDASNFEVELDITKLPVGMYLIRFQCDNKVFSDRIIKN